MFWMPAIDACGLGALILFIGLWIVERRERRWFERQYLQTCIRLYDHARANCTYASHEH